MANEKTRVWVDTDSGTYGSIESLRVVDVPSDVLQDWANGEADSKISAYAEEHGKPVR